MTDEERKEMARFILSDPYDGNFDQLSYPQLQAFYGAGHGEVVPTTACCAKGEARRILGEPEASELTRQILETR